MAKNRILFLDIDGVFIPARSYFMATQTKPLVTTFDPCVVGMVNKLCHDLKIKLVIHSSWLRTSLHGKASVIDHMVEQGLKKGHFHADHDAQWRFSGTRWLAITEWLDQHPETKQWWALDDEVPTRMQRDMLLEKPGGRIITTDFDEGVTMNDYNSIRKDCGAS